MANNIFTGKTVEEAKQNAIKELGVDVSKIKFEVIKEGKPAFLGLFGGEKAEVKATVQMANAQRAVEFIDGLLKILKITAFSEIVSDDEKIVININATSSSAVIGRHGETIEAIQSMAGAVANIGNDKYKKVVVDCDGYRQNREDKLVKLAEKLAKSAVEKGRKVTLEPMKAYERRIIHSALAQNPDVKTVSDGKEPNRYVVIIPNNLKPYDKKEGGFKGKGKGKPRFNKGGKGKENRDEKRNSSPRPPKKGKKEIYFGTFLGNSGAGKTEE